MEYGTDTPIARSARFGRLTRLALGSSMVLGVLTPTAFGADDVGIEGIVLCATAHPVGVTRHLDPAEGEFTALHFRVRTPLVGPAAAGQVVAVRCPALLEGGPQEAARCVLDNDPRLFLILLTRKVPWSRSDRCLFAPREKSGVTPHSAALEKNVRDAVGRAAKTALSDLAAADADARARGKATLMRLGLGAEPALREAENRGLAPTVSLRARRCFEESAKGSRVTAVYAVVPLDRRFPNDPVVVFRDRQRQSRAFLIDPAIEVSVIDVDKPGDAPVYKIVDPIGRSGWVGPGVLEAAYMVSRARQRGPSTREAFDKVWKKAVLVLAERLLNGDPVTKRAVLDEIARKSGYPSYQALEDKLKTEMGQRDFIGLLRSKQADYVHALEEAMAEKLRQRNRDD